MSRAGVLALCVGLSLVWLALACQPSSSQPTPQPTQADPFAVVRATADAAYRAGQADLDRGQLEQALVELDRAKTNDPDNRPEIQQALEETVRRIQALPPATETAIVGGPGLGAVVTPPAVLRATAAPQASVVSNTTPTPGEAPSAGGLVMWRDPQGRFSIGAPPGWETSSAPQTMFGTGVVGFREPAGQAEMDVAVDTSTRAVSPELYAASMELAMQQVPGYAVDSVQPGTTAGNPSVRRVFSQTRQDASGKDYTARGFQLAIVRGSTAYVVSAFAPANNYSEFGPTFERMLDSLVFG